MTAHVCGPQTPRARALEEHNALLSAPVGSPEREFWSEQELAVFADEAVALGRELEAEGCCPDCGWPLR